MNSITVNTIIPAIRNYLPTQPITKAWLFGSYSRGEETIKSDVDILVSFEEDTKVGLFQYANIVNELEALLKLKVDLVEDGTLLPFARESVDKEKVLIYEKDSLILYQR